MAHESSQPHPRGSYRKLVTIGLLVFLALLAGVALLAWLMGETLLSMEYEGFD